MQPAVDAVETSAKRYGEKKGDRKRARAAASQSRREARQLASLEQKQPPSSSESAATRWDEFYRTKQNLFKDRHLLRAEFPELMSAQVRAAPKRHVPRLVARSPGTEGRASDENVEDRLSEHHALLSPDSECDLFMVEVGCGTGNAVFPILRANEKMFAFAFDFSHKAVQLIKANSEYRTDRVFAFQADICDSSSYVKVVRNVQPDGVHFVTAFWTLSALPPGKPQQDAARGMADLLKKDGMLFIRDYAIGDMREEKFSNQGQRVQTEGGTETRLYLRGDGTYAYFFEEEELKKLFFDVGFTCDSCEYIERQVENRKNETVMRRRWLHAKFRKGLTLAVT